MPPLQELPLDGEEEVIDGKPVEYTDDFGHWVETTSVINVLNGQVILQSEIIKYDGDDSSLHLHLGSGQVVAINAYGIHGGDAGIWYFILNKPNG